MYDRIALDDLESREVDDIEPTLKAVGYELRPEKMRPSVWEFERGESNMRHKQREQEELYFVLEGRLEMEVDTDTFEVESGAFVLVSPDSWRMLTALDDSIVFVVGAPNVKDDGLHEVDTRS